MAIVVPFLLSSTAVGTAIGLTGSIAAGIGGAIGMSAGLFSTIASVAFQVTGVNDKINKAASKVFGDDLVKFANIAGAGYAMFNGGFDIGGADAGGAAASIDPSSAGSVNGMDAASDAFSAANSAAGGGLASDGFGGIYNAPGTAGNVIDTLSSNGLSGAKQYVPDGGMNSVEMGIAPDASAGTDLINPGKPLGVDSKVTATAPSATEGLQQAAAPQPGAAGVDAAGNKYSLVSQGNASAPVSSSGLGVRPPASLQPPAPAGFGAKAGSFFDRLLNNEKAMGLAIQGLGQGLTAAQANKAQQEALDWQKKRYTATGNFRVVQ